jgi:hypothetical protein
MMRGGNQHHRISDSQQESEGGRKVFAGTGVNEKNRFDVQRKTAATSLPIWQAPPLAGLFPLSGSGSPRAGARGNFKRRR